MLQAMVIQALTAQGNMILEALRSSPKTRKRNKMKSVKSLQKDPRPILNLTSKKELLKKKNPVVAVAALALFSRRNPITSFWAYVSRNLSPLVLKGLPKSLMSISLTTTLLLKLGMTPQASSQNHSFRKRSLPQKSLLLCFSRNHYLPRKSQQPSLKNQVLQ